MHDSGMCRSVCPKTLKNIAQKPKFWSSFFKACGVLGGTPNASLSLKSAGEGEKTVRGIVFSWENPRRGSPDTARAVFCFVHYVKQIVLFRQSDRRMPDSGMRRFFVVRKWRGPHYCPLKIGWSLRCILRFAALLSLTGVSPPAFCALPEHKTSSPILRRFLSGFTI
jgi:hypothetical protein